MDVPDVVEWRDHPIEFKDWLERDLVCVSNTRIVATITKRDLKDAWHVYINGAALGEYQLQRYAEQRAIEQRLRCED